MEAGTATELWATGGEAAKGCRCFERRERVWFPFVSASAHMRYYRRERGNVNVRANFQFAYFERLALPRLRAGTSLSKHNLALGWRLSHNRNAFYAAASS